MTVREKLLQEINAAITAVYGDLSDEEFDEEKVASGDVDAIANKVKFYMDL